MMADSTTPEKGSAGGKLKLETLPRDDLIKFVKKQMVLLHRTKQKCDELGKQVTSFSETRKLGEDLQAPQQAEPSGNIQKLEERIELYRKERDDAVGDSASLHEERASLASKIQQLTDENCDARGQLEKRMTENTEKDNCIAKLRAELSALKSAEEKENTVGEELNKTRAEFQKQKDNFEKLKIKALKSRVRNREIEVGEMINTRTEQLQCKEVSLSELNAKVETVIAKRHGLELKLGDHTASLERID